MSAARRLAINITGLSAGEYFATLEVTQNSTASNAATISRDFLLVLAGPAQVSFSDIVTESDDTVAVTGSATLDLPTRHTAVTTNVTLSSQGVLAVACDAPSTTLHAAERHQALKMHLCRVCPVLLLPEQPICWCCEQI